MCLVFCDHDPERFERAAVRWLGRFCHETPGVALRDAHLVLAALAALAGPARTGAASVLADLSETYAHDDVAHVLEKWLKHRSPRPPDAG